MTPPTSIRKPSANRSAAFSAVPSSPPLPRFSLNLDLAEPAQKIAPSDRITQMPHFSPDEKSIAFVSDRSGHWHVWIARADGTEARDLTAGQPIDAGAPRWSPDGARIVFDRRGATGETDSAIYVIEANGKTPARVLSSRTANSVRPAWSADGQGIYFSSNQTGARHPPFK